MYDKNLPYVRVLPSLATKHRGSLYSCHSLSLFFRRRRSGGFSIIFEPQKYFPFENSARRWCMQPADWSEWAIFFVVVLSICSAPPNTGPSSCIAGGKRWRQRDDRQRRHLAKKEYYICVAPPTPRTYIDNDGKWREAENIARAGNDGESMTVKDWRGWECV